MELKHTDQQKNSSATLIGSLVQAFFNFSASMPMLAAVLLLIGLFQTFISPDMITSAFRGHMLFDPLAGAGIGSVIAGNPIMSYILGGELLESGVSLIAVSAFLVAWVTVGIVQFPLESSLLGRRFAIVRNVSSFLLALVVAVFTVVIMGLIQ